MQPLCIDEEQQQKTIRGWVTAAHRKIACLLTMTVLLVLLLIFITLYVSGQRVCGAQKEKLDSINEATEALSKRLDWQDKQIGEDLVNLNGTNASQRTTVLEMQEKMDSMYKVFKALSKRLDSLDVNMGRKLDLVNAYVKNASQRTSASALQDNQDPMFKAIEALSKHLDSLGTNMERKLDLENYLF
ncbi:uncharacterized protein [Pocillopora verrucosa]|uniref:uncharacterized protein n=1 Tax=Pocillopora verrucosa TaxID=203993 RepID=UPI003340F27C